MRSPADRFWEKVARGAADECWPWTAAVSPQGYGVFNPGGRSDPVGAHRMAIELTSGAIPEGRQVHHTCRRRDCVNPAHLMVVTAREHQQLEPLRQGEHNRRKTHCPRGHEYDAENTRRVGSRRVCRACRRTDERRRREARRAA